jgi:hypothetical protein
MRAEDCALHEWFDIVESPPYCRLCEWRECVCVSFVAGIGARGVPRVEREMPVRRTCVWSSKTLVVVAGCRAILALFKNFCGVATHYRKSRNRSQHGVLYVAGTSMNCRAVSACSSLAVPGKRSSTATSGVAAR